MKFIKEFSSNIKNDTLAGMTVSLAMIPEVVAFAFVAKIDPLVALSGAFMIGLITAVFGGRPGLISGAAGAVAVIFVNMIAEGHEKGKLFDLPVDNMGFFYLFAAVILMGVLQIAAGYFRLGRFVRLIPHPVMLGFVNGLAVVIFMAQLDMFPDTFPSITKFFETDASFFENYGSWLSAIAAQMTEINEMTKMIGLVAVTMLIIHYLPKLSPKIPSALAAILVISLFSIFSGIEGVATVGSYIKAGGGEGLKGHFPTFNTELWANLPINLDTLKFIFPYAFLAASVGLIESLMTLNLVDELTDTRGDGNKECIGQGIGNIVSGLFGGTGGCGMIGQTMININAKGRGRLSGVMMALTLLSFILFAAPYIEMVPIAALVGVMFMMVIETFAWSSLRIMRKIPASDAFVLVAVSLITVFADLAIAVFAGVIISALVFAWENAKRIRARKYLKEDGTKVYEVWGPLFFGAITAFNEKFDIKNDPQNVEIDFLESRISDQSAIEAINVLAHKYKSEGKHLILKHLSSECKDLLLKADPLFSEMIEDAIDDPRYHVAADPATFE
jgi:SulP family sulfate permease